MGDTDGHHFYLMSPRKHFISLFLGDGGVNFYRPGVARWDLYLQQKMLRERLADWTCPDLAELAHGACTASWGGWGDRFLQLGNWRLGALDTGHFGICHRNGMNAHMYRHDGTVFLARQDPQLWRRPLGFPYGITFGKDFIQIGSFRIMAGDKDHLSISHPEFIGVNFRGWDSTVWLGKETHDKAASEKWSGWWGHHANKDSAGSAGPTRVMYGDRVLQIGNFRIGQMDSGDDLLLTHVDGHLKRTVSRFTSSGQVHAGNQDYHRWTSHIIYRPLQYHCSSLEDVMELCPGITAGDRFIQIGDFRISQSMPGALSISHRSGLVSKVFFSDGRLQTNLGGDASRPHNAWWKEARELHHADAGSLKFGDRFIQIGDFRLGADEGQGYDSVILTHRHFDVIQFWNHNGGLVPGANVGARHHHRGRDIWARPVGPPRGVSFGDRFVQIGNYRFGAFDGHHFTVAHKDGVIAELFTGYDGLQHNGPIAKWTTFGRPMRQCKVMPPRHRVP
ncbi:UVR8 [Symbiodinium sp. KB8]|nr:UVR8 [Symbiodinium sp. KB8]